MTTPETAGPRPTTLGADHAAKFATLALAHVTREYPNHVQHLLRGPDDVRPPRALHPVFFGSYDWHSCVHGYWLLARVLRRHPTLPEAARIRALFDAQLTPSDVAGEAAYFTPERGTFERPYGWAWLLALAAELSRHDGDDARRWAAALAPLVDVIVRRWLAWLPRATYPIRAGTHFNTAFAVALSLDYAERAGDATLAGALRERATLWYGDDADCQAWEPNGDDFLSSALVEAECMRRVLAPDAFPRWLDRFLPRLVRCEPVTLFTPATVSDRSDAKIAHLDGLNLSRAWCWRAIASSLSPSDRRRELAHDAADAHLAASLPYVAGDYVGEHWLATFATLALDVESGA